MIFTFFMMFIRDNFVEDIIDIKPTGIGIISGIAFYNFSSISVTELLLFLKLPDSKCF